MAEHPILFSGPMVRAILEGRKTQTRRGIRNPGRLDGLMLPGEAAQWCPYGHPGDLLWVRETFAKRYADAERDPADGIVYRVDGGCVIEPRWTPAIHMPRWASRITLRITDVQVQRLQEITESDAAAEGCCTTWDDYPKQNREAFAELWDKINGKRAPWASNPWIWAISFERV